MLKLTHQISGPIYKMTKFFNEVAKNPLSDRKIYFRKNDFFTELAEAYNKRFEKDSQK